MAFDNGVNPDELYIRQAEIVRMTGIGPNNVSRDMAQAGLKPVKVFGIWMYYRADVDAFWEKRQPPNKPPPPRGFIPRPNLIAHEAPKRGRAIWRVDAL